MAIMAPAVLRTFGTVELLERILLELTPRDILLLQRVKRKWKATIAESIKLKRALFFEPAKLPA